MPVVTLVHDSPVGRLRLTAADHALTGVWFPDGPMPTPVAQAELAARARGDAEPEVRSSHWDEARAISRRRAGDALVDAATVTATSPALRILDDTRAQLDRYFAGRLRTFDLPLAPQGTDFQRRVWTALTQIPFGTTTSYGAVARTIGLPEAVRAVGAANGQNPIPVIIPCHRVIGANGTLTGFGGGLPRKRFLLALERGDDLALAL